MRIPPCLLTQTCVLRRYRTDSCLTERVLISSVTLRRVRISPAHRQDCDIKQVQNIHGGVLYFDAAYSLPEDEVLWSDDAQSVIVFGGAEYPVTGAEYLYDGAGLHHIELTLGGAL